MFVYVRNADGAAVMPCSPAKARKLLTAEKAKILEYRPFTIQLCWPCEGQTQEVKCGIDKGSSVTGVLCTGNATALLAADIHHRQDVKEKMDDRKDRRASRRSRLWYRPARLNDPTLRGKTTHLYADLRSIAPVSTVYGYETATYRKYRQLPKGKGRVRYQVNSELQGFRKGDLVNVYDTIKINCYVKYTCDHFLH
jgi:hypothetical protein